MLVAIAIALLIAVVPLRMPIGPEREPELLHPDKVQIARSLAAVGKPVNPDFMRHERYRPSGKMLVVTFESLLVRREPLGVVRLLWVEVVVVYRLDDSGRWDLVTWR